MQKKKKEKPNQTTKRIMRQAAHYLGQLSISDKIIEIERSRSSLVNRNAVFI